MNEATAKPKAGRMRRLVRWLTGLCALGLLFGGGLVINASRLPSRQIDVESVDVDVDAGKVAEILAELITVPSFSFEDRSLMDRDAFLRLHAVLEERFPRCHQTLSREAINELSLLYRWPGRDPTLEPILLMSHLDVVPIEEESKESWTHSVDSAVIKDGFVWGRGALDVKCGVIAIMSAVETLIGQGFEPERTVLLAFGHDEEVGGEEGNAVIARKFASDGTRLACVLDEGGAILDGIIPGCPQPIAFVALAEKRPNTLTLIAKGEGGHGSMPGRSAIINLSDAILLIDQNPMPTRITDATETMFDFLGPEMPWIQRALLGNRWLFGGLIKNRFAAAPTTNAVVRSTVNFTQLNTESAENQSATIARATINARMLPGDSLDDLRDHLLKVTETLRLADGKPAISVDLVPEREGQSVAPVDCREFEMLQRSIHEVFPDTIVAAGLTTVSTDSRWYYDVTDRIYRFIPMRMQSADMLRVHGIDERIGIENLAEIVQFYVQFLRNAASS